MTVKEIQDFKTIQKAFSENKINFVNGAAILDIEDKNVREDKNFENSKENLNLENKNKKKLNKDIFKSFKKKINQEQNNILDINKSNRVKNHSIFQTFIQNQRNAKIFYGMLEEKSLHESRNIFNRLSLLSKEIEESLNNTHRRIYGDFYSPYDAIIFEPSIQQGILMAIEIENEMIIQMIDYEHKNKILSEIQKKLCILSLLHTALYVI
ncbi:MAG: hypothetical protein FWF57_03610 [Defluviitaleaceae bacterium]|nr:hypothetical protein [Defluviitaleaceae bacterium]